MMEGIGPQLLDQTVFYITVNLAFSPTENAEYFALFELDTRWYENPFYLPLYFVPTASKPRS
jgi:hypothetical protein